MLEVSKRQSRPDFALRLFNLTTRIAENTGALGDRQPGLLVDPPGEELGDPTVRIGVAGRPDKGRTPQVERLRLTM